MTFDALWCFIGQVLGEKNNKHQLLDSIRPSNTPK